VKKSYRSIRFFSRNNQTGKSNWKIRYFISLGKVCFCHFATLSGINQLASSLGLMQNLKIFLFLLLLPLFATSQAAEETVFINDDVAIKLYYFAPAAEFETPRLAILLSGGSNDEYMAQAQYWIGKEMVDRGWAIAVPISPKERKYFVENTDALPKLVDFIHASHDLDPREPLLVGVSGGGSAALAIAAQSPSLYAGVIATPGRIWNPSQFKDLDGLPIYLRIGENDSFRWNKQLPTMVDVLHGAGGNVDAALMPGEKHIFELDWENFDAWLEKLQQPLNK
jgi:predicted esterase